MLERDSVGHPEAHVDEQRIVEALAVLKDADSVELKLTVLDTEQRPVVGAHGLDVLDGELRQVVFFDTPDLRLSRGGVVVRARRVVKGGDSVIKLRPVVPASLPRKLRRTDGFKIEVDVMPGTFVCSGSLRASADNADIRKVIAGKRAIRKLFSPEQRDLYAEHAPKGLELDSLLPFGPVNVAKLQFPAKNLAGRRAVAELWFYPDGSRVLELSTKCAHDEAFDVLAETRAALLKRGITPNGAQETKTRKALEYFSRVQAHRSR